MSVHGGTRVSIDYPLRKVSTEKGLKLEALCHYLTKVLKI